MPHPLTKHTEYVGTLSDGETSGYWLLALATPFHGRAIPCSMERRMQGTLADYMWRPNNDTIILCYKRDVKANIPQFAGWFHQKRS
jgi:hypothetical protein